MNPNINLEAFIFQNHLFMTVADISEETGADREKIEKCFKKMGIIPKKISDIMHDLILEKKEILTADQLARILKVSKQMVNTHCKKIGVHMLAKPFEKPIPAIKEKTSIQERLNTVNNDVGRQMKSDYCVIKWCKEPFLD